MLSNPSIGTTDLVFVPSDKLGKEYEGNLFVGEIIFAFYLTLQTEERAMQSSREFCIHIWGCSNVLGWRLEFFL
jgi:hypothetical protein